jgi:hypothetical protein
MWWVLSFVYVLVAFFEHGVLPPNGNFLQNTGRQNKKKKIGEKLTYSHFPT